MLCVLDGAMTNNKYRSVIVITLNSFIRRSISGKQFLFVHKKCIRHQKGIKPFPFKEDRKIRCKFWNPNVKTKMNLFIFSVESEIFSFCSRV